MRSIFLSVVLLLIGVPAINAQVANGDSSQYPYWIDMMGDPEANFFETQRAFELYWEGRTRQKSDGWKVFKRWEHFMEQRVDEHGNKPKPGHVLREYQRYMEQNKSAALADENHWDELGPVQMPSNGTGQPNGLGRINCIGFHPSNASILYVGAASGGVWKTTNHGSSWTPLTDTLPTLAVSSIVVDYSDDSTVFLGTGDRDGSDAPGRGVWVSNNAGKSWNSLNSGMGNRVVGRLLQNPQNSDVLIAATNAGIYKSYNKGQSWTRKSSNTSHYKDLEYNPNDTNILYATASGDFYRSVNGGESWSVVTSGLPSSNRMVIGVTPDDANVVYVLAANQRTFKGLYLSTNSGASFSTRSTSPNIMDYSSTGSGTGGQAWYDLCIAIDPDNETVVYAGGVNIFKSTNSGSSWAINAHWVGSGAPDIHADQHELEWSPVNGNLYSCNDGGLYYSTNGSSWTDISSGLAIAQIYKIGQSTKTKNLVINGYQDNGTSEYTGSWRTVIGGDGMECLVDPTSDTYKYGSLYYGDIRRSTGGWYGTITNSINETGEWVTPYVLEEGNSNVMYAGFKSLWKSTNVKAASTSSVSWTKISSTLGASSSNGIRVLETSPADKDLMYIAVEDNSLHRTDNLRSATPSFTSLKASLPTNTWPRDIEADPKDANKVYIVQSNNIYYSSNKGASWTDISGTLPNVSMNCIVIDSSSQGNIYVGSDMGVFFKGHWMSDWVSFNGGMPYTAEVTELEIYYHEDRSKSVIRAATYGRGLWSSPLYIDQAAEFSASKTVVCANETTSFKDESEGFYTEVSWSFPGGSPGTSAQENPIVTYSSPGTYQVKLTISNLHESDSRTKSAYIMVIPEVDLKLSPTPSVSMNRGDSVKLEASGAKQYTWTPSAGLSSTTDSVVYASPFNTTVYRVTGSNPDCSTSEFEEVEVDVLQTSVEEIDNGSLAWIFPNPVDEFLQIQFDGVHSGASSLTIHDITGKLILERNYPAEHPDQMQLSTSELQDGVYFLSLNRGGDQNVFRLIVKH
jgi:PKD repeat protein/photosystem II stability/assembly factor-like uncharacterized protein